MSNVPASVALGLIAALVANPTVWTAKLDGKDGSKISGTARVGNRCSDTGADR
jgi:hypothetical protein